jgi:predicted RNA-binding Zn-ribbon protein involved in translation (DUF1610 family)
MGSPTCPSCGAAVQFRSAAPYTVCPYCRSLLIRRDASLEAIGRVAEVPDDLSPLQLHTAGVFEKGHFTLIGRIRKTWEQGSWSEWCASFDQPQFGWLAEAQGDLVMTFEHPITELGGVASAAALTSAGPGTTVSIAGRPYSISDVKVVTVTAAEGELSSAAITGMTMTSIDLRGPGVAFATVEIAAKQSRLYVGRYVEFDECRFSNLRQLEGW